MKPSKPTPQESQLQRRVSREMLLAGKQAEVVLNRVVSLRKAYDTWLIGEVLARQGEQRYGW